ncbi:MAG: ABC transporter permease [Lachnospiraceae bacterium]|nr:ABC transporter permease [Lachnospiraceae bacterium]
MKNIIKNLTLRQMICCVTGAISLLLFLGLTWFSAFQTKQLTEQQMAKRWSNTGDTAQISCFFSQGTEITKETFQAFEAKMQSALQTESITSTSENPSARMWVSAYSGTGEIVLANGTKTVKAKAVGVGGEFFLFHPLQLLNGNFFSGSDVMQDYVVIDEDTAWQLFGSNDVAGMQVTINNIPHIVSGVIKRETGYINDAAGNGETTVYLSYNSLVNYGKSHGINCYEIVLPNPITGYGINLVKENIGIDEMNMECIENSTRYSLLSLGKVFLAFGTRSMSAKAIIYPYWENVARGLEDILALVLLFRAISLLIPVVMVIVLIVKLWKKRTWSWRDIPKLLKKGVEAFIKGIKSIRKGVRTYKRKTEKEADLD